MKIPLSQLPSHLQTLPPYILLIGEEPLLIQEALDALRQTARKGGYEERLTFNVEARFDWKNFQAEANTLSLFNPKRLLELHLHAHKLGEAGKKALQEYTANPPADVLIIIADKLDNATLNANWCKTIDKQGIIAQAWPMDRTQLSRWITQRLQQREMSATPEGIQTLIDHTEGHLLATAQEIEKLHLLFGTKKLSNEDIANAITTHARFNVFQCSDALLQHQNQRTVRILHRLHQEGIEPPLLLWAITRELRTIAKIAMALEEGQSWDQIFQTLHIWEKRKSLYKNSVIRHTASEWLALIQRAATIDCLIKGAGNGNVWNALEELVLSS